MKYEKVAEVNGRLRAEFFKSYLEAQGIDVQLFEESISHTNYGLPFGAVQVFVPKEKLEAARALLASYVEFQPGDGDEIQEAEE